MQCPTCKQELEAGVRFCPHDGTPLHETFTQTELTPTGVPRPAPRTLELPVVIGNRYRLEAVRGGGGMAKVYRGVDTTLEREVAVKLINPELRSEAEFDARFQREARIASQLADPHIVVVHDFGLDQAHGPYLVMEYLHGQSLRERLAADGKLPVKAALQLAGQVFLALLHAHEKGIVHRDIKPDNIFLLNQSGVRLHVRVLDFGIARIYRRDDPSTAQTLTHAGAVLGTPRYMSPEQLAGQPVDARSDLYSAALVLFEALTGSLPYVHGGKLCDLCPEASQPLQELLEQCLKPNPIDRPKSAVEVYLRLQELGKASGILLLPPGALDRMVASRNSSDPTIAYQSNPRVPPPKKRRWVLWATVLVLLVNLGFLAKMYYFTPTTYPPGPESLHGIHLGDSSETVEKHLSLTKVDRGNPWMLERTKSSLGHLLQPEDLQLPDADLKDLVIRRTSDDQVVVLFHQEKVVGLISTSRSSSTNRKVSVGGLSSTVGSRYDDHRPTSIKDIEIEKGGHIELRRYDSLGLGFEIQAGKLVGMCLYPTKNIQP